MNKFKLLKGVCLVAATSMIPISQAAMAEVSISGWINHGIQFWDDGQASDATALHDNGNTLGDRLTFTASSEVATGLTGGIELITEFGIGNASLWILFQNSFWLIESDVFRKIGLRVSCALPPSARKHPPHFPPCAH